MKIRSIETYRITLPFRFAFGHSLASRNESTSLIVKVTLNDGTVGYGEGIPRDYVTGENIPAAEKNVLSTYAPLFLAENPSTAEELVALLQRAFDYLELYRKPSGASWCALELALLDAYGKLSGHKVVQLLGGVRSPQIRYGGVIPFGGFRALKAVLVFYKMYGFKTIKLKVGSDIDADVERLKFCRRLMGQEAVIRVDANCAWNLQTAMRAAEAFTPYKVASYEQPLPADDLEGMRKLTAAVDADVMADESLCTLQEAGELARNKVCTAFNIRISKAGGLLPSQRMLGIAKSNGIKVQMGAQVGETGILSAAGRIFACLNEPLDNYEGSANFFLLKQDLTRENLTVRPGGLGDLRYAGNKHGLGITIDERRLLSFTQTGAAGEDCREQVAAS